ncbi:MAG: helix-turn-helix domain-containing protein [Saprospiraceae bacterium]
MEVSRELLFFFSALGAFNGLLLGSYFLFIARPKQWSNFFLGMLLTLISVRTGKSVFFHFNPDLAFGYLQFGLTACFFIGPFLYFYCKSVVRPKGIILKEWKYHLAILIPLAAYVGFRYPFEHNVDLWRPYILNFIYSTWAIYALLAGWILMPVFKKIYQRNERLQSVDLWLLSIWIGNVIMCYSYSCLAFTSYITGALSFSFLLYLLLLLLFFNRKESSNVVKNTPKYAAKKIDNTEASAIIKQLAQLMEQEEGYKNAQLKLPAVAEKLNVSVHRLSQILNDNLGKNFSLYVNEYRVAAAKKMLLTHNHFTLEAVGYECGFNSKSSFYATFKSVVGTTPAQFKKQELGREGKIIRS